MKKCKYIFCLIGFIYSCSQIRSKENLNEVYNRIKVTNPLLFRDWEIANTDRSNSVSFHYIYSNRVLYDFISYEEGNNIFVRTISRNGLDKIKLLQDVDDAYFPSINGFDVVKAYFKLKVDYVAYSPSLNGIIFKKRNFYFAYLFQPIDSAFIASTPYKSLEGQWYYYAR
ncbi:hypothetical protein SIO70_15695 [Chitinophaga sancti]|uniref:hypothetical protein n=1 Tax=Chitinophaga sancti TaxID=1004 RepID=UPI002A75DE75|nr:hypothetical protein [Chitinophaga sancti]WPQ66304.1 hypothetical protein SIO70_15695 [Chitinophaga sancti]